METLPAYAKVSEYQLRIVSPDDAPTRVTDLVQPSATPQRELWAGSVAFAPMSLDDFRAFLGWLAQFDGRKTAFGLPMPAGLMTVTPTVSGTLFAAANSGNSTIRASLTPAATLVAAGTLVTLGSDAANAYQVVEVLADATTPNTNLALESETLATAPWGTTQFASTVPVLTSGQLGPDGNSLNAFKVDFGATATDNTFSLLTQTVTVVAGATYTLTVQAKAFSAADVGKKLYAFGSAWVLLGTLTANYQRFSITFVAGSTSQLLWFGAIGALYTLVASNQAAFSALVTEVQLEEGATATAYGKTTTAPAVGPTTLEISPRIRWKFDAGAALTLGATNLRVRLAADDAPEDHDFALTHGTITLDLVEGIYA